MIGQADIAGRLDLQAWRPGFDCADVILNAPSVPKRMRRGAFRSAYGRPVSDTSP